MKRWIRWASRLYPAEWRVRYGGEFDVLLEDARLRWTDLADVVRGAVIMQMTRWMSYWKMALAAGIAGAVLVGGYSFTIPNQWACTAALVLTASPRGGATAAQELQGLVPLLLSRDNLVAIIQKPGLGLYSKQRQRMSDADVAWNIMRRDLFVVPYDRGFSDRQQAFKIIFHYPDRFQALTVVRELISEIEGAMPPGPRAIGLDVLEYPSLPMTPIGPNRAAFLVMGALGGMILGLLTVAVVRRTRGYVTLTLAFPREIKSFVDSQVSGGRYRDAGEYVRELIRADREKRP